MMRELSLLHGPAQWGFCGIWSLLAPGTTLEVPILGLPGDSRPVPASVTAGPKQLGDNKKGTSTRLGAQGAWSPGSICKGPHHASEAAAACWEI